MKISLDSPFFEKGERVGELLLAGFMWIIFCIPVITIGAASSALYYTTVKVVRRKRDTVWRSFWNAFKSSFRQGTVVTMLYLLCAVILVVAVMVGKYIQTGTQLSMLAAAGAMISLPFLLILPWIFAVISRFSAGILRQFQYALHMAIGHLPMTLLLLLILAAAVMLIFLFPFLMMIVPGGYAWLSSLLIERVMKSYMRKELEKYADSEELPWYLE